jgi:hypothetical protein
MIRVRSHIFGQFPPRPESGRIRNGEQGVGESYLRNQVYN